MAEDTADLRQLARDLFMSGVAAADPAGAVKSALSEQALGAPERLALLAIGKAACTMVEAALAAIQGTPLWAMAVTNPENARDIPGVQVKATSHPVPSKAGLQAAKRVADAVSKLDQDCHLIVLVSGGGSALLPLPVNEISLDDKILTNEVLLKGGLDIVEMNLVRQNISQLKGGGLARLAEPARVTALMLSDVIGDQLEAIASGPTVAAIGTPEDALRTLKSHGIIDQIPQSVRTYLSSAEPKRAAVAKNQLIGSNTKSVEAVTAAVPEPFNAVILSTQMVGNVRDAANAFLEAAKTATGPIVMIAGGETTVEFMAQALEAAIRNSLCALPNRATRSLETGCSCLAAQMGATDQRMRLAGWLMQAQWPALKALERASQAFWKTMTRTMHYRHQTIC
jgi:hydroxypyruvate reductase